MEQTLIIVNDEDEEIGLAPRNECHNGEGKHHRAFVVLLFNRKDELLLQRRAMNKLWGGFWDCSAGSHVLAGETYESAIDRCLRTELGVNAKVRKVLAFNYVAKLGSDVENEYCALYTGYFDGDIKSNPKHVLETKYVELKRLVNDIEFDSAKYTPWLKKGLTLYLSSLHLESGVR